jgi:N-acyl homoserine lactone hydrolase
MAARDPWRPGRMRPRPDHARVVVSTGDGVDPPRHLASTWKPTYPWLRTSRHWTKPLPINAYVIEHRDGIMLFDTGQDRASVTDSGYFPGGATWDSSTTASRASTSTPAIRSPPGWRPSATTSPMCELRCCPISTRTTSTGCRNSAMPPQTWSAARSGSSYNNRWEPRGLLRSHVQLPGLHWRRIELAPTDDPGLVPFTAGHPLFGDGSLVLLPTPGHTPGSLSVLVRRPGRPWLLLVGDLTHDAHLLEHGHLPGVGSWTICRARCAG